MEKTVDLEYTYWGMNILGCLIWSSDYALIVIATKLAI